MAPTKGQQMPPTLKKSTSGSQPVKNQMSIAGFFKTQPASTEQNGLPINTRMGQQGSTATLTPAPSSDAIDPEEDIKPPVSKGLVNGLPSPITPAEVTGAKEQDRETFSSPSRKVSTLLSVRMKLTITGKEGGELR